MKNYYILILSFLFLYTHSLAQDCNGRYLTNIYTDVDVTTVKYGEAINASGNNQELFLDIYQAQGDTGVNRPLVIFAFGGSFVGGSRTSAELVAMSTELAKKGYVCASIDYRLANSVVNLIQEEVLIKTVFRAIQDGNAAIRFFRNDADTDNEYKINPNQIFIGGTSAGGILAINLAYVEDLDKLTPQWKQWAEDIGGFNGGSTANSGYCNYVQGVFGFAGAIGDTSYIDENSVPFYGSHATDDETVQYGFGPPLQGFAPASLYGSGLIDSRLNNLGLYSELDTYAGGNHPPLAASSQILNETTENLTSFLYNILECNPNNQLSGNELKCSDFEEDPNSIYLAHDIELDIYPNPANNFFNIDFSSNEIQQANIFNVSGQLVQSITLQELNTGQVNISNLNAGIYFIEFNTKDVKTTRKLIKY